MIEWLAANWLPLLIFIIVVVGVLFFILKKKGLRQAAIDAIVYVQEKMGTEDGKVKMQNAVDYIQQIVPFLGFVPDSIIQAFIQGVFDQIKSALKLPSVEQMENKEIGTATVTTTTTTTTTESTECATEEGVVEETEE
jgi:hypothetical protein